MLATVVFGRGGKVCEVLKAIFFRQNEGIPNIAGREVVESSEHAKKTKEPKRS